MSNTLPLVQPSGRLAGLDLARFIAFFGMLIVNFNLVLSRTPDQYDTFLGTIIEFLEGRAAATFVVLAGLGLGLAAANKTSSTIFLLRITTLKRGAFLLLIGLLNYLVFDADILHYYGIYFMFGALLLNSSKRALIGAILVINIISSVLIINLDYEAGWNWNDQSYSGFWTIEGFTRNLFFNGWHPVFPWLSYLLFGIVISRYSLSSSISQERLIIVGLIMIICTTLLGLILPKLVITIDPQLAYLVTTSAIPPMPLYILSGIGSACFIIGLCLKLQSAFTTNRLLNYFITAGRQSLTLYLAHIFIGMASLEVLGWFSTLSTVQAFICATAFCCAMVIYTAIWSLFFSRGPAEALMRRISG